MLPWTLPSWLAFNQSHSLMDVDQVSQKHFSAQIIYGPGYLTYLSLEGNLLSSSFLTTHKSKFKITLS